MAPREDVVELAGLRVVAVGDLGSARAVVALLHGFSMAPGDLSPFAHSMGGAIYYLLPEGPVPAAPAGRAWFAIDPVARAESLARGPRDFATQHPPDLPAARARVGAFLDEARSVAGARPLVACGFSQGGMVLLDTLLRSPRDVGALALLSSSRIAFDEWRPHLDEGRVTGKRVLVTHGAADDDLAFTAGEALRDCLIAAGAEVSWLPFEEGHQIPLVVWRRLRKLIETVAARST